jgi:hypothetical protein
MSLGNFSIDYLIIWANNIAKTENMKNRLQEDSYLARVCLFVFVRG